MKLIALCTASACLFAASQLTAEPDAVERPNFVIIMADDLGYGDLGCYGSPSVRTPRLDRMASEGLRFTDFYVGASVCTPSRAALLTGRLAIRSGMAGDRAHRVLYPEAKGGLPPSEITIATALKKAGYATACIGKWHLGDGADFLPTSHGFDTFFGLPYSNDMNILIEGRKAASISEHPQSAWWDVPLMRDTAVVERPVEQSTLTQRYTAEAIRFIDRHREEPFLLYFPHTFPHVPLFASGTFRGTSRRGLYGDTVEEIDWSVGMILEALRARRLEGRTLVCFTSDNGPWLNRGFAGGSPGPLRDGKGGSWEGGFRVPGIMWWPGRIPAGRVTSEIASTMDLLPTLLGLAGVPVPSDRAIDGEDLTPLLFGSGTPRDDVFFFYRGDELCALRKGKFKAHFSTFDGYSKLEPVEHDPAILYDLARDPGESLEIGREHPEVVLELTRLATEHRAAMIPGPPQIQRTE